MRKTISKLLCMVTVLAVVLTMMPAAMVSAAYTERLPGVTVHLLGDSTVTSYETSSSGITGWGQGLEALLSDYVEVNNWAISGLSTNGLLKSLGFAKEYAYEEQWTTILKNVQAGDYVFIQFGHNDQKTSSTDEIDVAVEAEISVYKENLAKIITDTTAKGATPILVTPPERQGYATAQETTLAGYPEAMIEVANANSVAYIDLNSYSKTALAGKTEEALTAYYAVDDKTHFSAEGALDLAKYIAGQLSYKAPALVAYVKTDYESVTTSAISYGKTYRRMNFSYAITDTTSGTSIANVSYDKSFTAASGTDYSTSMIVEADGNKVMKFSSDYERDKKTLFDALANGNNTTPLFCYDFSVKLPKTNSSGSFIIANTGDYKREVALKFYSDASNIYMTATASDGSGNNRTIKFTNVEDMKLGEWNKIRVIMDTVNEKYHLIANGKLVCTDIPYYQDSIGSAKNTRYIYIGTGSAISGNEVYFDDIYIKSISERQAIKMLLNAADKYLSDVVFEMQSNKNNGYVTGNLYLPANASVTNTKSFVWGEHSVGGNTSGLNGAASLKISDQENASFATSTLPQYMATAQSLYAANGYANGKDSFFQYTPTITVGGTTENTLYTASFTIKRRLMLDSDDGIEVSVPKLFDSTTMAAPNGDNSGWAEMYKKISASTNNNGANSAIGVKNTGNAERKVIVALCFYEDGKLAAVSSPKVETLSAGDFKGLSWYTKKEDVSETGTVAKLLVIDAKTLMPLMDAITIE